ncbi:MAG TPA: HAD family hydrolase [Candidatus Dormibacteraeota bacterium]
MASRGVVFDLFGTLVLGWGQDTAAGKAAEIAAILGAPLPAFRDLMAATYTLRANGQLGDSLETVRHLAEMVGHDPSPVAVERAAARRIAQFREVLSIPRPEVSSLLAVLRARGIGVGLISDCSAETPIIWPTLPWAAPIQAAVFSWSEGVRKPDPRLYLKVSALLGLTPGECLYVGDGGSQELSGAARVGMEVCQLLAPRADGQALLQYDPDPEWSGPVISSLSEILPRLAC